MTIREQIEQARQQEFLTVEQAALLTQYHPYSLYRLIAQGRIAVLRIGRSVRIPRSAIRPLRAQHPRADSTMPL